MIDVVLETISLSSKCGIPQQYLLKLVKCTLLGKYTLFSPAWWMATAFPLHTMMHRLRNTEVNWLNIHMKSQDVWGVIFLVFLVLSLSRLCSDFCIETCWYMQLSDMVRGLSAFYWLLSIPCRMQQLLLAQWTKNRWNLLFSPLHSCYSKNV